MRFLKPILEDIMKATTLKINGTRIVPVDTIRFIKPMTDEDRNRAGGKLEIDASKFNVRIEFADKSTKLAVETIEQIERQGVVLVNIGADRHVPAVTIRAAEEWSKEDAAKLKDSGDYTLSQEFRSRVETTAGTILSTLTPEQVMERRGRALGQGTNANTSQTSVAESTPQTKSEKSRGPRAANG
jgi:hypothetical protein